VRHGDIIDAITPLFAKISSETGTLVENAIVEGQRVGGLGGQETILKQDGCIITGLNIERGSYFGREEIVHLNSR
jgi:hypothetical protein